MVFTLLEPALAWNGSDVSYHDIAQTLHTSVSAVQQQVKRMRVRFRALLEKEINETVSNEKDAVSEREYLIQVLSKK